jgi:hypothetical protein
MTVEKSLVFSCAIVLFLHPCAGPVNLCAEEPQDAILKRVEAAISVHEWVNLEPEFQRK